MLTIADVKRDLPDVPATWRGKPYRGKLTGRRCEFPEVTVFVKCGGRDYQTCPFSWDTVTRAINSGRPLEIDQ